MTPHFTLLLLLAQSPEQLRPVFPQQAAVTLGGEVGDWARLPLPDAVLRQVDRDLADVRLFDSSGRLVPFVVQRERPFDPETQVRLVQISATRKETPAGPGTPNLFEETAIFALPTQRARTPRLEFSTPLSRFVRRAVIEALTEKGAVVGRIETLFRLPGAGERLEVWMPALEKDALRLRVTLNGQDDGFVTPSAVATFAERGPPETTLEWPITQAPRREGKSTVWQLEKPRGIVPMRLSVKTTTPWFNRQVIVRSSSGVQGRSRGRQGERDLPEEPPSRLDLADEGGATDRIHQRRALRPHSAGPPAPGSQAGGPTRQMPRQRGTEEVSIAADHGQRLLHRPRRQVTGAADRGGAGARTARPGHGRFVVCCTGQRLSQPGDCQRRVRNIVGSGRPDPAAQPGPGRGGSLRVAEICTSRTCVSGSKGRSRCTTKGTSHPLESKSRTSAR